MSSHAEWNCEWLRFQVGEWGLAIPLEAVAEVTMARQPRLIPLVPLQVGGVLNVRGEPLPAVDGSVLIGGDPGSGGRHAIVLEKGRLRVGVLVDRVSSIERGLGEAVADEPDDDDPGTAHPDFVRWVRHQGGRLGLVDAEVLLERATDLLAGQAGHKGGELCLSAF